MHHNFVTHRNTWRLAILAAIKNSPPSSVDEDDKGFWEHELKAFDEAFGSITQEQALEALRSA